MELTYEKPHNKYWYLEVE